MVSFLLAVNSEKLKSFLNKWGFLCGIALALIVIGVIVAVWLILKKNTQEEPSSDTNPNGSLGSMDNGFFRIEVGNCQGLGERDEQQDAFGFSPNAKWKDKGFLAVLCDGMGGLDSGAVISNKLVSDVIKEFPYSFEELKDGWIIDSLSADIYSNYYGRGGSLLSLRVISFGLLRSETVIFFFIVKAGSML